MHVPVNEKKIGTRHNIAKKSYSIDKADQTMLNSLNKEDNILYERAFEFFSASPLKTDRGLSLHSFASASGLDSDQISSEQLKAAQKKFILSLRGSIGEIGVENYIRQIQSSFACCEQVMTNAFCRKDSSDDLLIADAES